MTTAFGTTMRGLATSMLSEFGIPATVTITEGIGGTDANGSPVLPSSDDYTVTVSPLLEAADTLRPEQLQQLGAGRHRVCFLAAENLAFTPQAGMSISVDSEVFTVKDIQSLRADERVAAWVLVLEG